ncbi:MAG: DNA polymerase [bacterium]|jgi:DNA polymerase I-like protein with 3'-5' exonuclease and polymerase domains
MELTINSRFFLQPARDYVWCSHDYSGQELRLSGALSGDKEIHRIYILEEEYELGRLSKPLDPDGKEYDDPNVDQHLVAAKYIEPEVARRFLNEPWLVDKKDPVVKAARQKGKIFNFKVIYGGSAASMASDLGCSNEEAEKLLRKYFNGFSGLYEWIQVESQIAARTRWIKSALGRHIQVNEDNAKGIGGRGTMMRKAVNAIIQGSGADMTKLALPLMRRAFNQLEERYAPQLRGRTANILNVSHDEVNFEAPGYIKWYYKGNAIHTVTDPDEYKGKELDEFMMARDFSNVGKKCMEDAERYLFDKLGSNMPAKVEAEMSVYWKH